MKGIGEFLKYIRKQRGLTQEQVAARLNIATPVLSKWENDKAVPSLDMLCKLCNILNISIEECIAAKASDGDQILPPENYDAVKLGSTLKELRIKNGLSQAEVGKKFFVTSQTVSKWEGGGISSLEILCKFSELFVVTPTQLLNGLESTPTVLNKQITAERSKNYAMKLAAVILAVIMLVGAVAGLTVWLVLKNKNDNGDEPVKPPEIQLVCPIKSYYEKQQSFQDPVMVDIWVGRLSLYFESEKGEEIYAAADGVIIACDAYEIVIEHEGYTSIYEYTDPQGIDIGSEVKAGQLIAKLNEQYFGFSLEINGETVAPLDYLTELPEPVSRPSAHVHEWEMAHNNVRHWQTCECGATKNFVGHTFDNNKCTACGYENPTSIADADQKEFCLPVQADIYRGYLDIYDFGSGPEEHKGVDFSANADDEVYAIADGVIESFYASDDFEYCYITIDHGGGLLSIYYGLKLADDISEGCEVKKGDVIGVISSSPYPTEKLDKAHLHFVVTLDGANVNPLDYIPYE